MDEITAKRIEKDQDQLTAVGAQLQHHIHDSLAGLDIPALEAEMDKLLPRWAGQLTTVPGILLTYATSRFMALGAPIEHALALLEAGVRQTRLGEEVTPIYPMVGAETPAWIIAFEEGAQCSEHRVSMTAEDAECIRGGAADQAFQCGRLLSTSYDEFERILIDHAYASGLLPEDVEWDAASAEVRRLVVDKTLAAMRFYVSVWTPAMQAMGA